MFYVPYVRQPSTKPTQSNQTKARPDLDGMQVEPGAYSRPLLPPRLCTATAQERAFCVCGHNKK